MHAALPDSMSSRGTPTAHVRLQQARAGVTARRRLICTAGGLATPVGETVADDGIVCWHIGVQGGAMTTPLADPELLRDLVLSNRILANEGVVDAFGHVSIRHPDDPGRFIIS